MIRLTCPNCESALNAKDELLGQTRNCPKCGAPVLITEPDPASEPPIEAAPGEPSHDLDKPGLPTLDVPKQLDRQNHYLICDRSKLVATWRNDGQSWMLKTKARQLPQTYRHRAPPGTPSRRRSAINLRTPVRCSTQRSMRVVLRGRCSG